VLAYGSSTRSPHCKRKIDFINIQKVTFRPIPNKRRKLTYILDVGRLNQNQHTRSTCNHWPACSSYFDCNSKQMH